MAGDTNVTIRFVHGIINGWWGFGIRKYSVPGMNGTDLWLSFYNATSDTYTVQDRCVVILCVCPSPVHRVLARLLACVPAYLCTCADVAVLRCAVLCAATAPATAGPPWIRAPKMWSCCLARGMWLQASCR